MLIYHPIYDANHCIFRLLVLTEAASIKSIPWNTLRLMDFYYLFPHMMKRISPFPQGYSKYRKSINQLSDSYETISNSKRVLFELERIQYSATQNLIAKGILDVDDYQKMKISRTETEIPYKLQEAVSQEMQNQDDWMEFITDVIPQLQFDGVKGLKYRSKLMEYRYDPV